jgi:hypothetical protein
LAVTKPPRQAALASLALAAALVSGCGGHGVTVVLSNADDPDTFQAVCVVVRGMMDRTGSDYSVRWSTWGQARPTSLTVSPVDDPAAWSRAIRFGVVEKVKGRVIWVRVNPAAARWQAAVVRAAEFVRDLPNMVRGLGFYCQVKAVAWWQGRPEPDVAWTLWKQRLAEATEGSSP